MDEQLIIIYNLLFNAIKGERHQWYKRNKDYAEELMKLITGEDLDSLLIQFVKHEDAELFEQRKAITQHIIPAVCKNLMDVFYKVPRSNSIQRVITYDDKKQEQKKELIQILEKFWGNKSHDDYLGTRFLELNFVDPNSFMVLEWKSFAENERAQPYPYEVKSENAVNYEYVNNILQFLIDMNGDRFTFYGMNQTIIADKIDDKDLIKALAVNIDPTRQETFTIVEYNGLKYMVLDKDNAYLLTEPIPHKLEMVPAFRVGYNRDLYTDGTTFVNPFHAAICYLKKTLKLNSELDLSSALVAFPQQLAYVQDDCENEGCYRGMVDVDGSRITCPTCKGTGVKASTSVQNRITLKLPNDPADMYDLEKLIAYKMPPVEILKWQSEAIDSMTANAKSIVFNSDIFDKKQIADTATGKNLDAQNVYDTLYPFVVQTGEGWKFIVTGVAKITQLDNKLTCVFLFQKDFKLKSTETLIDELSAASKSGADAEIVNAINNDIIRIIYEDSPIEFMKYQLKQQYNPFKGKTSDEVTVILSGQLTTQYNKVLYTNLGNILDELETESFEKQQNFYELNRKAQDDAIKAKVEAIMNSIKSENPDPTLNLL